MQTRPNHLSQLNWTNPITNKVLLEATVSGIMQHYDVSRHRYYDNPQGIPRVSELQGDATKRVNQFAGSPGFDLTSGSLTGGEVRNIDSWRSNVSASYITGSHNAKVGYNGAWFSEENFQDRNDPRLAYAYNTNQVPGACSAFATTNCIPPTCSATVTSNCWPVGTPNAERGYYFCSGFNTPSENPYGLTWPDPTVTANNVTTPNPFPCGNMSLYNPGDLYNAVGRVPTPTQFTMYTGPRTVDERVQTHALFVQDQWTLNRFTINGALRYDNASSSFNPTCIESDTFVANGYCAPVTEDERRELQQHHAAVGRGVGRVRHRQDVGEVEHGPVPRGGEHRRHLHAVEPGAAHDEHAGAQLAGLERQPRSGLLQPEQPGRAKPGHWFDQQRRHEPGPEHAELGASAHDARRLLRPAGATGSLSFATDPLVLDAAGLNSASFTTTQCGRDEAGVSQAVLNYCEAVRPEPAGRLEQAA